MDFPDLKRITHIATKSAWFSKINIAQAVGFVAILVAMFGVEIDAGTQAAIVAAIGAVTQIATWVMRTWFTVRITNASAARM